MAKLLWKTEYLVGIDSIDDQHREILAVFNGFLEDSSSETYRKAYRTLGGLIDAHFKHEEELMLRFKLPHYREHKAWHDEVRKDYAASVAVEIDAQAIGRVRGKLYRWIVDHVLDDRMDRGLSLNLKRAGIYRV